MQDEYITAFSNVVVETRESTGIELPDHIEQYVILLLASRTKQTQFLPQKTFAESFLGLENKKQAKELGDHCLFITGVFPDYGISIEYYSTIGKSSYQQAAQTYNPELFENLSDNFDIVRFFINCIKDKRDKYIV